MQERRYILRNKRIKPNFRVKHPYGYLIKSMMIGFVLVFCSIVSLMTGFVDLTPKSTSYAENWTEISTAATSFASGSGTKSSPYIIKTVAQWRYFKTFVNNYNGGYGYYFALGNDIDFSGGYYDDDMSIGALYSISAPNASKSTTSGEYTGKSFGGVFYGRGYKLKNVTFGDASDNFSTSNTVITTGVSPSFGIFGSICGTSVVKTGTTSSTYPNYNSYGSSNAYYSPGVYDLVVENPSSYYTNEMHFGVVCGAARYAVFKNVFVYSNSSNNIVGAYHSTMYFSVGIGGIVGEMAGCQMFGCKVDGLTVQGFMEIGGLVGFVSSGYGDSYIINCQNNATVKCDYSIESDAAAGGIVGYASVTSTAKLYLRETWNTGIVTTQLPLGSSSTDGDYSTYFANGHLGGLVGTYQTAPSSYGSYLDIRSCANWGRVYANTYISGTSTAKNAYYALAYNYTGDSSYSNFYTNYYGYTDGSSNSSNPDVWLDDQSIYSGEAPGQEEEEFSRSYYFSSITSSADYPFSVQTYYPVSGTSGYSIVKPAVSSPTSAQSGTSVAKKIYVNAPYTNGVTYTYTNLRSGYSSSSSGSNYKRYTLLKLPYAGTTSSTLTFTGATAGYGLQYTVYKYASDTSWTVYSSQKVYPSSGTTKASFALSFANTDIYEYYVTISSFQVLSGSGTFSSPYQIKTAANLDMMELYDGEGVYFELMNDVSISKTMGNIITDFKGIFLGDGHTITNTGNGISFCKTNNGKIINLNIIDSKDFSSLNGTEQYTYYDDSALGFTVAHTNYGTIDSVCLYMQKCTLGAPGGQGYDSGNIDMGPFVINNTGTISNCYVGAAKGGSNDDISTIPDYQALFMLPVNLSSKSSDPSYYGAISFGGICAQNTGTVVGNSVNIYINISDQDGFGSSPLMYLGGIVGRDMRTSTSTNAISDNYFEGSICNAQGSCDGSYAYKGGIIGYVNKNMEANNLAKYTRRNISYIQDCWDADSMFGSCCFDMSNYNFSYSTYTGNKYSDEFVSNQPTYTKITSSTTYSIFDTAGDWDPKYWIAMSGSEGVSLYGSFTGKTYYPRSKKTLNTYGNNDWAGIDCEDAGYDLDAGFDNETGTILTVYVRTAEQFGFLINAINNDYWGGGVSTYVINFNPAGEKMYFYNKYISGVTTGAEIIINGNYCTLYGIDLKSNYGGHFSLFDYSTVTINDLTFSDCSIVVTSPLSYTNAGFIVDDGQATLNNVTFENCHIIKDNDCITQSLYAGFVCSWSDGGNFAFDGVSITAEEAGGKYFNSTIYADNFGSGTYVRIGGLVGDTGSGSGYFYVDNVDINGLDIILGDENSTAYNFDQANVTIGGVVGFFNGCDATFYIQNSNFVGLNIDMSHAQCHGGGMYVGGLIGCYDNDDSTNLISGNIIVVNIDLWQDDDSSSQEIYVGGLVGAFWDEGVPLYIQNNDIYVRIYDKTLTAIPSDIGGVVGYNDGIIYFENNVMRIDTNMFLSNKTGIKIISAYASNVYNNIFKIVGTQSTNAYATGFGSSTSGVSNNAVDSDVSLSSIDLVDSTGYLTTQDELYIIFEDDSAYLNNNFYYNKYFQYADALSETGYAHVRKYYSGGTKIVPNFVNSSAHYYTPLTGCDGKYAYSVYDILDSTTAGKVSLTNNIGADDTTVKVYRNGYLMPYSSSPTNLNIWMAAGDYITAKSSDSSKKFDMTVRETDTTYYDTLMYNVYGSSGATLWDDYIGKNLHVDISTAVQYFAIHNSMSATGATKVGTRGDYNVYSAAVGASVTITKTGNTAKYSTLSSSYITGLTKGTVSTAGSYSSSGSITATSSSTSADLDGYYKYTFTVSTSNTTSSTSGSVIAFGYGTGQMKLHKVVVSADTDGAGNSISATVGTSSSTAYMNTSASSNVYFSSVYVANGVTVNVMYKGSVGEWANPSISGTTYSNSQYVSTGNIWIQSYTASGLVTNTVTYKCNTYYTEVLIKQDDFDYTFENSVNYGSSVTTLGNVDASVWWGSLSSVYTGTSTTFTTYSSSTSAISYSTTASTKAYSSAITNYMSFRRQAYLTYNSQNFLGSYRTQYTSGTTTVVYVSVMAKVKYNTTITMTPTCSTGYQLSAAYYSADTSASCLSSGNVVFTVTCNGSINATFSQNKWDDAANISTPSGSGTTASPYIINSGATFGWMVNKINAGTHNDKVFKINADISLAGKYISPITQNFTGTIDGTSSLHSIKNMSIRSRTGTSFMTTNSGTIQNLIFVDPLIESTGTSYNASFVDYNDGTIQNVGMRQYLSTSSSSKRGIIARNIAAFVMHNGHTGTTTNYTAVLSNVFNNADMYAQSKIITFVYENYAIIKNCYDYVLVSSGKLASSTAPSGYAIYTEAKSVTNYYTYSPVNYVFYTIGSIAVINNVAFQSGQAYYSKNSSSYNNVTSFSNTDFSTWDDFNLYWNLSPSYVSYIYLGQFKISDSVPLLRMGQTSGVALLNFYIEHETIGLLEWGSGLGVDANLGWKIKDENNTNVIISMYVVKGQSFSFFVTPYTRGGNAVYLSAVGTSPIRDTEISSGFTTSFSQTATGRSTATKVTVSNPQFADSTTQLYLFVMFYSPKVTFTSNISSIETELKTTLVNGQVSNQMVTPEPTTFEVGASGEAGYTLSYSRNSSYAPLRFSSFGVGSTQNTINGGTDNFAANTKYTRYVYVKTDGSAYNVYSSKDSYSGYTYVGRVDVDTSSYSNLSGTMTFYDMQEDLTIMAYMKAYVTVSFSGLASGTTNTIKSYYNTTGITTSTTSTLLGTTRASGATTSSGSASYLVPLISNGSDTYVGSIMSSNVAGYVPYQVKINGGNASTINTSFTVQNYAYSNLTKNVLKTSNTDAKIEYIYKGSTGGSGLLTATITLQNIGSYLQTKPTTITISATNALASTSSSTLSTVTKTFSSVASSQTVTFQTLKYCLMIFTVTYTSTEGNSYRFIWSRSSGVFSDGTGTAGATAPTYNPPTGPSFLYYLTVVQLMNTTVTTTKNMSYNGVTWYSQWQNTNPNFTVSTTAPKYSSGYLAGYESYQKSTTTTDQPASYILSGFDYGSTVSYSLSDVTLDSTSGLKYSDVFSSPSSSSSTCTSNNGTLTITSSIIVNNIKTTITNRFDEDNSYIGVVAYDNNRSLFNATTKHSVRSDGKYLVQFTNYGSGSSMSETERDWLEFSCVAGEKISIVRMDLDGSNNYVYNIASITFDVQDDESYKGFENLTKTVDEKEILYGVRAYICNNNAVFFTYYPWVTIGFNRALVATSQQAKHDIDTLLPTVDGTNVIIQESSSMDGTYTNSTNSIPNTFEAPTYIKITYKIPYTDGWKSVVWSNGGTTIPDSTTESTIQIGGLDFTYKTSYNVLSYSGTQYRIYTLTFHVGLNKSDDISILNYQFDLTFTEVTYYIATKTIVNNGTTDTPSIAYKSVYEYVYDSTTGYTLYKTLVDKSTAAVSGVEVGYFGNYKVTQSAVDTGKYKCISGADSGYSTKRTSNYTASATFYQYYTVGCGTGYNINISIAVTYVTSGRSTSISPTAASGSSTTFTVKESTTNTTIGTVTVGNLTSGKVLYGSAITVSVTTTTPNKVHIVTTPSSSYTITGATTISAAWKENSFTLNYYRNTDSITSSGSAISGTAKATQTLGALNVSTSVPTLTNPGSNYSFSGWTAIGTISITPWTDVSASIDANSLAGTDGSTIYIVANWRRTGGYSINKGSVDTSYITNDAAGIGGSIVMDPVSGGKNISTTVGYTISGCGHAATCDCTSQAAYVFNGYTTINATVSGSTVSLTPTSSNRSGNTVTFNGTTYYISNSKLYKDSGYKVEYGACDYTVNTSTVDFYDNFAATVGASFSEKMYIITVEPNNCTISVTVNVDGSSTSGSEEFVFGVGHLSTVTATVSAIGSNHRFKGWSYTGNQDSIIGEGTSITLGDHFYSDGTLTNYVYTQSAITLTAYNKTVTCSGSTTTTSQTAIASPTVSGNVLTYGNYFTLKIESTGTNAQAPSISGTAVYLVVDDSATYTVKMTFTPKTGYYWSGFASSLLSSTLTTIGATYSNTSVTYSSSGNRSTSVVVTFTANNSSIPANFTWYSIASRTVNTVDDNTHTYTATKSKASFTVAEGENVTIKAVADSGWVFDRWTFSGTTWTGFSTTTATQTFAVCAGRAGTYTAHFKKTYTMSTASNYQYNGSSVSANSTGATATISVSPAGPYAAGTEVTLTATANDGYQFYGWYKKNSSGTLTAITSSDGTVSGNKFTFTVKGIDCCGNTYGTFDISTYTIVCVTQKLYTYTFKPDSTVAPSAKYEVTSSNGGVVKATTTGTNLAVTAGESASATLTVSQELKVVLTEGAKFTFTETHTLGEYRATGILKNNTSISYTLLNNGLTGVTTGELTANDGADTTYKVTFTKVHNVATSKSLVVTYVTYGMTQANNYSGTNADGLINISLSGTSNSGYYDTGYGAKITHNTIPTGFQFEKWVINGTTYTTETVTLSTLAVNSISATLYIKEIEYNVSGALGSSNVVVNIKNTATDTTYWLENAQGIGIVSYKTNYGSTNNSTSQTDKIGYFGTISGVSFNCTSTNKAYLKDNKFYWDLGYTKPLDTNWYSYTAGASKVSLWGKEYTISSNAITINPPSPLYNTVSVSTPTPANIMANSIIFNVVLTRRGYITLSSTNKATNATVSGAKAYNTGGVFGTTVALSATDLTSSGYKIDCWEIWKYTNGVLANTNQTLANNTSVTHGEATIGNVYKARYIPTYNLTVKMVKNGTTDSGWGTVTVTYTNVSGTETTATLTAESTLQVLYGTSVTATVTAVPAGYRVYCWTPSTFDKTITFTMTGATTITHQVIGRHTVTITHNKACSDCCTIAIYEKFNNAKADADPWVKVTNTTTSGNTISFPVDNGGSFKIVVTTSAGHYVKISGDGTLSGTNETYCTGSSDSTIELTNVTATKSVTIYHREWAKANAATTPTGLGNTVTMTYTDINDAAKTVTGTESITDQYVQAGKTVTVTSTSVSGYAAPTITNSSYTPEKSSTTKSTVSFTGTTVSLTVEGYADLIQYKASSVSAWTSVSHPHGAVSLNLSTGVTGIDFQGFNTSKHSSWTLYVNNVNKGSITSATTLSYSFESGATTLALRLVITNKTWLDSGAYTAPSGEGTYSRPYLIASGANMAWVSYESLVNANTFAGKYLKITNNIDLSGRLWVPIQNFNGVIVGNAAYSINNIDSPGEKYNFSDSTLNAKTITYSIQSLIAKSNGGVFSAILFNTIPVVETSGVQSVANCSNNVATTAGLLVGEGTNIVVDFMYIKNSYIPTTAYTLSAGMVVGKLTGGKLTNIHVMSSYVDGACLSDNLASSGASTTATRYIGGIVGQTINGTSTYFDSDGVSCNVVVENVVLGNPAVQVSNTSNKGDTLTIGRLIGNNTATISIIDVLQKSASSSFTISRGTVGGLIGNGTATKTSRIADFANGATAATVQGYYNEGGNAWYYVSSSNYGLMVISGATNNTVTTLTATNNKIYLDSSTTIAQFEGALTALETANAGITVELLSDLDFGGQILSKSTYVLAAGNTFNGNGYTISGLSRFYKPAIWSHIQGGTLKNVVFDRMYVKLYAQKETTQSYTSIGIITGLTQYTNNTNSTFKNVTLKNSRIDYNWNGVTFTSSSGCNVGTMVGGFDGSTHVTDVQTINCKLYFSQYGATENVRGADLSGLSPWWSVNGSTPRRNIGVDTDIIAQSSYSNHYISGMGGSRNSIGFTGGYYTGNITTNTNAAYVSAIGYSVGTVQYAYASGTISASGTKSSLFAGNSGTFKNVVVSTNATSVEKSDATNKLYSATDANMKTQATYTTAGFNFTTNNNVTTTLWKINGSYPEFSVPVNRSTVTITKGGEHADDVTLKLGTSTTDAHGDVTITTSGVSRPFGHSDYTPTIKGTLPDGYYIDASKSYVQNSDGTKTYLGSTYTGSISIKLNTILTTLIPTVSGINSKTGQRFLDGEVYIEVGKYSYNVNVDKIGHGTVTGGGTYEYGDQATLKATPETDLPCIRYRFIRWQKVVTNADGTTTTTTVSTSATYSFIVDDTTAGDNIIYRAVFSNQESEYYFRAWITDNSDDTGYVAYNTSVSLTKTFAEGVEITKITREKDNIVVYTKAGGAISGYTFAATSTSGTLTFNINNTTNCNYTFETGSTSAVVTLKLHQVGYSYYKYDGNDRFDYTDAFNAFENITVNNNGTSSTIASTTVGTNGVVTVTPAVVYNKTLTLTFTTALRYRVKSVTGGTLTTNADTTVDGYTRRNYTVTISNVTAASTCEIYFEKDYWVDYTAFSGSNVFSIGHAATTAFSGSGTKTSPYQISNAAQLARMSYLINTNTSGYASAYYIITADIDLGNYFWTPINLNNVCTPSFNIAGGSVSGSTVTLTQRTISNLYIRVDEEESRKNGNSYNNLAFALVAYAGNSTFTGLTFDSANVSDNGGAAPAVLCYEADATQINFVSVTNSSLNLFVLAGSLARGSIVNNVNVSNINVSELSIVGDAVDVTFNNMSVSNNIVDDTEWTFTELDNSTITNIVADTINLESTYDNFDNLIFASNIYSIKDKKFDFVTQISLSSITSVESLNLDPTFWYLDSNNRPTVKMLGNGKNNTVAYSTSKSTSLSGAGTASNPYLISSANDYRYLVSEVQSGNKNDGKYFKLTADIDLSGGIINVLGYGDNKTFNGHIDGDFHTIKNAFVFDTYSACVGLIGTLTSGSSIKNLNIENINVIGSKSTAVAGLVASTSGAVTIDNINIYDSHVVSNNSTAVGGIVGNMTVGSSGTFSVSNSAYDGVIGASAYRIGGIVGAVNLVNDSASNIIAYIKNCHTSGVIVSNQSYIDGGVGGIVGGIDGLTVGISKTLEISHCYNNMTVVVGDGNTGGIIGYAYNTAISYCYNNGNILLPYSLDSTKPWFVAEIMGKNYGNTSLSEVLYNAARYIYNSGNISAKYGSTTAGHTNNGYSVYTYSVSGTNISSVAPTVTDSVMKTDTEMKTATTYAAYEAYGYKSIWDITGGQYALHRWSTQNRLYFEGVTDVVQSESGAYYIAVENGRIEFENEVEPTKDTDGRIFVYAATSVKVKFVPDANFIYNNTAQVKAYYNGTYSSLGGTGTEYTISFSAFAGDGSTYKVLNAQDVFINNKFTLSISTNFVRTNGVSKGEYESLLVVVLNKTVGEAYACTIDADGTYTFGDLKAGEYYVGVYTSMFFSEASTIDSTSVNFAHPDFYYTLNLSNETAADATISITATKSFDAWIYSKVEVGA